MTTSPPTSPRAGYDAFLALDNQFCFALHAASRLVVRSYRRTLDALDLTYPQYLVMLVLWQWDHEQEARPTVTALGERLLLDSGTLTPLLRRLSDKRYLVRERSSDDERELFVRVTDTGRALKARARVVPLSLLQDSPIAIHEIMQLRERLNALRSGLLARDAAHVAT